MKTKQQKREEAAKRFSILSFGDWAKSRGFTAPFSEMRRTEYKAYRLAKSVEAKALGIVEAGE